MILTLLTLYLLAPCFCTHPFASGSQQLDLFVIIPFWPDLDETTVAREKSCCLYGKIAFVLHATRSQLFIVAHWFGHTDDRDQALCCSLVGAEIWPLSILFRGIPLFSGEKAKMEAEEA